MTIRKTITAKLKVSAKNRRSVETQATIYSADVDNTVLVFQVYDEKGQALVLDGENRELWCLVTPSAGDEFLMPLLAQPEKPGSYELYFSGLHFLQKESEWLEEETVRFWVYLMEGETSTDVGDVTIQLKRSELDRRYEKVVTRYELNPIREADEELYVGTENTVESGEDDLRWDFKNRETGESDGFSHAYHPGKQGRVRYGVKPLPRRYLGYSLGEEVHNVLSEEMTGEASLTANVPPSGALLVRVTPLSSEHIEQAAFRVRVMEGGAMMFNTYEVSKFLANASSVSLVLPSVLTGELAISIHPSESSGYQYRLEVYPVQLEGELSTEPITDRRALVGQYKGQGELEEVSSYDWAPEDE